MIQIDRNLPKEKIDEIGHGIADAFFDYQYAYGEKGMLGFFTTRESMYIFMRAVFEAYVRSGCAWQTEKGEGFLLMTDTEGYRISLMNTVKQMIAESSALGGLMKMIEYGTLSSRDGGTLDQEMFERQAEHLSIDILAVLEPYQHQGFMREMMEFAYSKAEKTGMMVALETDDASKAAKYQHLGMILYRTRNCGEGYHVYDLIR